MKILSLLSAFLFIFTHGNSQTFEKYIKTEYDEIVWDAASINENEVVFGYNYGVAEINYQSKLYKLNWHNGQLTDSVDIPFSYYNEYTFEGIRQILNYNDTLFLAVGQAINIDTQDHQLFIIHFNSSLQISFDTLVGSVENYDKFYDYIINSDGNIVSVGQAIDYNRKESLTNNSNALNGNLNANYYPFSKNDQESADETENLVLYITDVFGNKIERVLYAHPAIFASTIIEIPWGEKYHFIRFFDNEHSFNILDKETLETDTIIEYPIAFRPRMAVKGLTDTMYYLIGRQNIVGEEDKYLSYLEINQNGTIEQQHIFNSDSTIYQSFKTFDLNSTNIYFGGVIPFTYSPPILYPERRWILLYKLSLDGEIIWQKFFKGEVNYVPYKLMTTPDNGVLIFSAKYDWNDPIPNQRDVHILKIDSDGNYVPVGMEEPLLNKNQILVYPNPAKKHMNFTFGLYSDLTIDIFDIHGRKVFSEFFAHSPVVDLSSFTSGVYIYTITSDNGFYERGKLIKE